MLDALEQYHGPTQHPDVHEVSLWNVMFGFNYRLRATIKSLSALNNAGNSGYCQEVLNQMATSELDLLSDTVDTCIQQFAAMDRMQFKVNEDAAWVKAGSTFHHHSN